MTPAPHEQLLKRKTVEEQRQALIEQKGDGFGKNSSFLQQLLKLITGDSNTSANNTKGVHHAFHQEDN